MSDDDELDLSLFDTSTFPQTENLGSATISVKDLKESILEEKVYELKGEIKENVSGNLRVVYLLSSSLVPHLELRTNGLLLGYGNIFVGVVEAKNLYSSHAYSGLPV